MGDLRYKIKAILDRECNNRYLRAYRDAEHKCVYLPRCDNGLAFPSATTCWMCHENDALAQEIALLKES